MAGPRESKPPSNGRTPTLLVAVDATTRPTSVCRTAADLASRLQANVMLLHVLPLPSGVSEWARVRLGGGEERPAGKVVEEDAKERLRPLVEFFESRGVTAEVCSRVGEVIPTLLACAEELDVLYVITGSDAPSGLEWLFNDGFANSLVRACPRPVLLVPPAPGERRHGWSEVWERVSWEGDG